MCVKCDGAVRYDEAKNTLFYKKGCDWLPLPAGVQVGSGGTIGGGNSPSLPPDDELPDPSTSVACYKANGAWAILSDVVEGLLQAWDDSGGIGAIAYAKFGQQNPQLKVDNWRHYKFWFTWIDEDDQPIVDGWAAHKATIQEDFICYLQDVFEKTAILSVADLTHLKAYDFDSPVAVLDDFLTDALGIVEDAYWKERAAFYATSQTGTCNCDGSEPTPEIPPLPENYFGLMSGEIISEPKPDTLGTSPSENRNLGAKMGTKVSNTEYLTTNNPAYSLPRQEAFIMFEATELIEQITTQGLYVDYTGNAPDGNDDVYFELQVYGAGDANSKWSSIITWGAEYDNAASFPRDLTEQFFYLGAFPFPCKFIAIRLAFIVNGTAPMPTPTGRLIFGGVLAKATSGGNYRALLLPNQWKPKTI